MPKILTYLSDFHGGDHDPDATELDAVVLAEFKDLDENEYVAFQMEGMPDVNVIARGSLFFIRITD